MTLGKSLVVATALSLVPVAASTAHPLAATPPQAGIGVHFEQVRATRHQPVRANHKAWFAKAVADILEGRR